MSTSHSASSFQLRLVDEGRKRPASTATRRHIVRTAVCAATLLASLDPTVTGQPLDLNDAVVWDQGTPGVQGEFDPMDQFGAAIAVGDLNHDGILDLAIGSPNDTVPGASGRPGTVNVLYRAADGGLLDGPLLHQPLGASVGFPEDADRFGAALAIGDFDCDGLDDLAVGVPGENVLGVADAGAVNVFYATGVIELWHQDVPGIFGTAEVGDGFGAGLSSNDLDFNGCDDLLVASPDEDVNELVDAGAMQLLYGFQGGITSVRNSEFTASIPAAEARFASDHATWGDLLAVATPARNGNAGKVDFFTYDFSIPGYVYSHDRSVGADFPFLFGASLDAKQSIAIGAPGEINTTTYEGLVDRQGPGGPSFFEAPPGYSFYGKTVAVADFDGDGSEEFAARAVFVPTGNDVVHVVFPSTGEQQRIDGAAGRPARPGFGAVLLSTDLDGDELDDLLIWDVNAVIELRRLAARIFADGFESGNTSAWSATSP